jgi:hypothetical protein
MSFTQDKYAQLRKLSPKSIRSTSRDRGVKIRFSGVEYSQLYGFKFAKRAPSTLTRFVKRQHHHINRL